MPKNDSIYIPDKKIHKISIEPAHNNLYSLMLLTKVHEFSGLNSWINRTFHAMSKKERKNNHIVIEGFYHGIKPEHNWSSFPEYVENLADKDPLDIRENLIRQYVRKAFFYGNQISRKYVSESGGIEMDQIFKNRDFYLRFLSDCFADDLNPELESKAYSYLSSPLSMQELTVNHFENMWNQYLSEEWQKNESMLIDSVEMFQQHGLDHMNELDLFKFLTNRDQWEKALKSIIDGANLITFVPSPHIGHYIGEIFHGDLLWILFGARYPDGMQYDKSHINMNEVLSQLNALSDEIRLQIIRLVLENEELSSQDIMTELNLSQSAASRHLKQLSALEFLLERRSKTKKYYHVNPDKVRNTLKGIIGFLLKE